MDFVFLVFPVTAPRRDALPLLPDYRLKAGTRSRCSGALIKSTFIQFFFGTALEHPQRANSVHRPVEVFIKERIVHM